MADITITPPTTPFKRDVHVISVIGLAHGLSHFFQLAVPPLFPLLKAEFDTTYAELGGVMAVFYVVSGICQTLAGFAVDRFGARRVLIGGMVLVTGGTALAGLAPSFWLLVPAVALAGAGNSVFHPADFALLNAGVSPSRLGRAYGVHGILGNVGWVLAPLAALALAQGFGWRVALIALGLGGLAVAALIAFQSADFADHRKPTMTGAPKGRLADDFALLTSAPILACFVYFTLWALSLIGVQTFSQAAAMDFLSVSLDVATAAVSGYMIGGTAGVVCGGWLADRVTRHDLVAMGGLFIATVFFVAIAQGGAGPAGLVPLMAAAGFFSGGTSPSRDMLVRAATPMGATGKVYGFVYSGLDLGGAIAPPVYGWFIDIGRPDLVFVALAAQTLVAVGTVVQVRRTTLRANSKAPA
ncbi:MAG: MFS transporter [Alphaproteobacteria bacterium]|nr:MFS transporter [Alphaproteobacteria bacterium]